MRAARRSAGARTASHDEAAKSPPHAGTSARTGRPGSSPGPGPGCPRLRERARKPFGPASGSAGCGPCRGRCLLGVRALPGSHLPTGWPSPSGPSRAERPTGEPRSACGRWTWLPVAACTCGATPHGPARPTQPRRAPGPTSCGGRRRTYSPSTSNCQHPFDLRGFTKSAGQCGALRPTATGSGVTVRRHGATRAHPFGRANTVRPATTVRSAVGRSPPGVRSGRPGVPERGSVDQLATRSSGVCTRRSPTLQTA